MLKRIAESPRLEVLIAILIAIVSFATAFAAWRSNMLGSAAGDAIRQGLIDALKKETAAGEDWRQVYQEAGYAQHFSAAGAEVTALEKSGDKTAKAQAKNMRQYLLPNLQTLADPLTTDPKYQKNDGTYDLEARFADLEADSPELSALAPETSFKLSDRLGSEQRWLTVSLILMAVSLFWLALAELNTKPSRLVPLGIGAGLFLFGLFWFGMVEVIFFFARGGLS